METKWTETIIWHKYPEVKPASTVKYYICGCPDIMGTYAILDLRLEDFDKNIVECWAEHLTTYTNYPNRTE